MSDSLTAADPRRVWLQTLANIGENHGLFGRVSARHLALFVDEGDTLVLTFDRAERTWTQGDSALPLGLACVQKLEYSLLSILSMGRTWFHDTHVEDLLQELATNGFFASFTNVLILAAGPDCGYAAARAARHAPGADVLLVRPAAPISDPGAPVDPRVEARRTTYRHATRKPAPPGPEALQQARSTTILFDPASATDAAQAALFRTPGTQRVALPNTGPALDCAFAQEDALVPLARHMADGTLTPQVSRDILQKVLRRDPVYLAQIERWALGTDHTPGAPGRTLN